MKKKRKFGLAGATHIMAACVILAGVASATHIADHVTSGKDMPRLLVTQGGESAACAQNTLETIVGTLGCGSVKKATHLSKITFTSAAKKD
ncbi:MAG: hypothetical protein ACKVPY_11885 [Paracoccaceae bacterium]